MVRSIGRKCTVNFRYKSPMKSTKIAETGMLGPFDHHTRRFLMLTT